MRSFDYAYIYFGTSVAQGTEPFLKRLAGPGDQEHTQPQQRAPSWRNQVQEYKQSLASDTLSNKRKGMN